MLNPKEDGPTVEETLIDFSEGRISRQRAMQLLDVDYSDLWDLLAQRRLSIPEISDEEAEAAGRKMSDFLGAMGV
ncbi:hypothetical protein HGO38_06710 [Rhizobium sp. CG5]|uniref:hypothetical protein n=1 Tax=Rhizobium sp. CG5 TaxID=2726076 RepID=UPI0020344DB9|nr:hypothetical protein [Rhizobium sp. CG5]MCM2473167.1 hypothetical protein [Rhizobium sp. CG5]